MIRPIVRRPWPQSIYRLGVPYLLGASGAAVSVTAASTSEEALAVIVVPANALGPNGMLRIDYSWSMTNSANNKTVRARFGSANDLLGTAFGAVVLTAALSANFMPRIQNRNATNSQVGAGAAGAGANFSSNAISLPTASVDTTAVSYVVLSGQKATGSETLTLDRYTVESIYAR